MNWEQVCHFLTHSECARALDAEKLPWLAGALGALALLGLTIYLLKRKVPGVAPATATPSPTSPLAGDTAEESQAWIDEQVAIARNYPEPALYSRIQAGRHPLVLISRWRHLNQVLGADIADTYLAAAGPGLGLFAFIFIGLGLLVQGSMGGWAWLIGAACGLPAGAFLSYSRFIILVHQETYIEVDVNEYNSSIADSSDVCDVSVAFLPRLGFLLEPEILEGNRGETGFRDKGARIAKRLSFGQAVSDLRSEADYYALQGDGSALIPAPSIEWYSITTLVRKCGRYCREYGVANAYKETDRIIRTIWPHVLLALGMLSTVVILAL